MVSINAPRYRLRAIQAAICQGRYAITQHAAAGAASLYLDEGDIRDCIMALEGRHFFKSMPSWRQPGFGQDVYRCRYCGFAIYTKLQMSKGGTAVVISFKRDESA
jgi:hypothetical protein